MASQLSKASFLALSIEAFLVVDGADQHQQRDAGDDDSDNGPVAAQYQQHCRTNKQSGESAGRRNYEGGDQSNQPGHSILIAKQLPRSKINTWLTTAQFAYMETEHQS